MKRIGVPDAGRSMEASLRRAAVAAAIILLAAAGARAQELRLFPAKLPGPRYYTSFDATGAAGLRIVDVERSYPWGDGEAADFRLGIEKRDDAVAYQEPTAVPPPEYRRCVLLQCVKTSAEPAAPPKKLFTTPVTLWTSAALFVGTINGIRGPIQYGIHKFRFTDEGFFQTWTYGGGVDKASHFVVSANVAGLLYDAYTLNGLTPDQSFALSLGAAAAAGVIVEIWDAITPYGFSAQDATADVLGALAGALVKRNRLDDLVSFRGGKVPTTIPPEIIGDRVESLGADYSNEMYTADLKFEGLARRLRVQPGISRFFLFSFAFLTKGYGYAPPIPERYQEIGLEVGLNFPEILKAMGVNDTTWWGDFLLRAFNFFRIPFTQVGVYYNLTNQKWYGPGAPYHF